ncbi:MAG: single-stranded DNA-binding protein [Tannerellaceae bacterium]
MSLNKVMLIGNAGKDPDVKTLDSGNKVANLTLATTDKGYTKQDGTQVPDRTEWHNLVVWGGLAKVVEQYVRKGTKVFVEGKLRTRSYEGSDGVKRYTTEVFVDSLELLGSKQESQQPAQQQQGYGAYQAPPVQQSPWVQNPPQQQVPPDDLPF